MTRVLKSYFFGGGPVTAGVIRLKFMSLKPQLKGSFSMFRNQSNQTHVPRFTMLDMILASVFGLLLFLATTYVLFLGLSLICGIIAGVFADGMSDGKATALLAMSAVAAFLVTLPVSIFAARRSVSHRNAPVDHRQH